MAILDPSRSNMNLIDVRKYWNIVKLTIYKVFRREDKITDADALEMAIGNISIEEQILFYHTEPLYIAADLVGEEQPNDEQVIHYFSLVNQHGWHLQGVP